MKNLITQIACTMLLMAFLMTFVSLERTSLRVAEVYKLAEGVEAGSGLSPKLKEKIAAAAGCNREDVQMNFDDDKKVIVVKLKNVVNPASFWHIAPEDNSFLLKIRID